MSNKNEVQTLEGQKVANPYALATQAAASQGPGTAMAQAESQRAMIEVMTSFEVAKRFPRTPENSMNKILSECSRPSLAEVAVYQFAKGGTSISGPSIRLMEAVARSWGNIQFGFRVLERRPAQNGAAGSSSIQAIARDLETNVMVEKTFDVKHWRDTKSGGYPIKDEREIYELEANQAQRRVRACIQGLIPGDVIDAAVDQCEMTMQNSADTSPEGVAKLLKAFGAFKVNKAMIEGRIQSKLEAIKPVQVATLRRIYTSLKDGIAEAADFFDVSLADAEPKGKTASKEKEEGQPDLKKDVADKKAAEQPKDPAQADQKKDDVFPGDLPSGQTLAKDQGKLV